MQLFLLWHRRAAFTTGKDDSLYLFRDGELRAQGGSGGLERRDARRDVVTHIILIEEVHLFLYRSVDAGIAGVQAYDEFTPVVKLFHQGELLVEVHIGRAAYGGSRFGTVSQFLRDETSGIQDKVRFLKHPAATDGNQFRITRSGSDYFDMSLPAN